MQYLWNLVLFLNTRRCMYQRSRPWDLVDAIEADEQVVCQMRQQRTWRTVVPRPQKFIQQCRAFCRTYWSTSKCGWLSLPLLLIRPYAGPIRGLSDFDQSCQSLHTMDPFSWRPYPPIFSSSSTWWEFNRAKSAGKRPWSRLVVFPSK